MSNEPIILICTCPICVSHRIEVYDHHPEIPWKTSLAQKKEDIRGIMKSYGCDYERALKIYKGDIKQ